MFKKVRKTFYIFCVLCYAFCFNGKQSQAVKIVAYVNDGIITDVDVYDFEKFLCKFDKRLKCGSIESIQMSLLGLVESTLKIEHFKQMITPKDKQQIDNDFNHYKKDALKAIKIEEKNLPKSFDDYLYAEYVWNIIMSSQIRIDSISQKEIDEYISKHNISGDKLNNVKQMVLQEKMMELSQSTISELKKFYLVDIKEI